LGGGNGWGLAAGGGCGAKKVCYVDALRRNVTKKQGHCKENTEGKRFARDRVKKGRGGKRHDSGGTKVKDWGKIRENRGGV